LRLLRQRASIAVVTAYGRVPKQDGTAMLLIVLGAVIGVVVGAFAQKNLVAFGIGGAVIGLAAFAFLAATAPRPKVPCWSQAQKSQIFRVMPFFCTAKRA